LRRHHPRRNGGGRRAGVEVAAGAGHRDLRPPRLQPARRAGLPRPAQRAHAPSSCMNASAEAGEPARTAPARLRSLLFAPGNRPDVCAKLPRSGPDAAVLDLEDAVPPQLRVETRPLVRSAGAALAREHTEITWYVRV